MARLSKYWKVTVEGNVKPVDEKPKLSTSRIRERLRWASSGTIWLSSSRPMDRGRIDMPVDRMRLWSDSTTAGKAWLRHRLPDMMWRFTFDSLVDRYKDGFRVQKDTTWLLYISWNMACPIFIYRLEVQPAEGVENGE